MKYIKLLILVGLFFLLSNCNKTDNSVNNGPSSIEIGNYIFNFKTNFSLQKLQGIDSYVGKINGSGISLSFDYGWYTSPSTNLNINDYLVSQDEINGHYRQIVKPKNSKLNYTKIHLFKISDSINSPYGYNSLTMSTNNLNTAEQEVIIEVFNKVEIIE